MSSFCLCNAHTRFIYKKVPHYTFFGVYIRLGQIVPDVLLLFFWGETVFPPKKVVHLEMSTQQTLEFILYFPKCSYFFAAVDIFIIIALT